MKKNIASCLILMTIFWLNAQRKTININDNWKFGSTIDITEANSGFPPLDPHITLGNPTVAPSNPNNADLVADLDTAGSARLAAPDIQYQTDANGNGVIDPEDIQVDIWITKTGTVLGGPRTGEGTGTVSFEMYEVRSQSRSAGNAAIKTGSTFRVKAN